MASYGSISPGGEGFEPVRRPLSNKRVLLGVGVVTALAACTLIVFLGVTPSNKPVALELTPTVPEPPAAPEKGEEDDVEASDPDTSEGVEAPTLEDVTSFEATATEVLDFLGTSMAEVTDKTDLDESCGDLMMPCLASVGSCVTHGMNEVGTGRLEIAPDTCQCFASGFANTIPLDGGAEVRCTYVCLDAISNIFDQKLIEHNGDASTNVACPRTFMNMARSVYGTPNDDFPAEEQFDGEQVLGVDDEKVIRAAEALQEHVNLVRGEECPVKGRLAGDPTVLFDEKGTAKGGLGQYRVEVALGAAGELFTGRVVHLPQQDQLMDPAEAAADPDDLLGRFQVMRVSPDPCAEGTLAELAVTQSQVKAINAQQLSWKAKFKPEHHEGVTRHRFGMGFTPVSPAVQKQHTLPRLATSDAVELPAAYDARDRRVEETECRAFDILDQGSCGSCYAFAAATALSARICRNTQRKWNVVMSPQEMLDCNNGCDGGYPFYVYNHITSDGGFSVENFCDPYQSQKHVCGGVCDTGNDFHGLDGSSYIVGDASPEGVKEMMKEILLHGPGAMGFDLYDDFYAYSEGVYSRTSNNKLGGHAVAVIGWGTENGEDYWLVQNSWGEHMGDDGVWKMRRGTNECNIEYYGLTVMTPEQPTECPQTECLNGGTPQKDCTCKCHGGWHGATCDQCVLQCQFGGVRADDCMSCYCPPGRFGFDCGGLIAPSHTAQCTAPEAAPITVDFSFTTAKPPTQKSLIGIYHPAEPEAMKYIPNTGLYICGDTYNAAVDGGVCPHQFSVTLTKITTPGEYMVAVVPWIPSNEFGQEGYSAYLKPADIVAVITVTEDCAEATLQQIEQANDLMTDFMDGIQAKKDAAAAALQAGQARLDEAERVMSALTQQEEAQPAAAEPAPSMEVAGVGVEENGYTAVWAGHPMTVCVVLPPSENVNPKHLVLFVGDGADGSHFPEGLIDCGPNVNAPEASDFCVDTSISLGIAAGTYTIGLQASSMLVSKQIYLNYAWVGIQYYWDGYAHGYYYTTLQIEWQVSEHAVSLYDSIQLIDSAGNRVDWFYTACNCQEQASLGSTPAATGKHFVTVWNVPGRYVAGGVDAKFFPKSGQYVSAVSQKWIPWASINM